MKFDFENNFEKNKQNKECLMDYDNSLLEFKKLENININNYEENTEEKMLEKFNLTFRERANNYESVNNLENPEYLENFFQKKKYDIIQAQSVLQKNGTTLFTSAGVQILDDYIFNEKELVSEKMFVIQPVIRTQFINEVADGISTSFINISTEKLNPTMTEHFSSIKDWLSLLSDLGINKKDLDIFDRKGDPSWGGKKFKNNIMMFFYKGLEIGDAIYAYDISQSNRESISFSDIGFGIERLKWSLGNDNYFDYKYDNSLRPKVFDYCKTLALLSGSNLEPSNNNQGYRFRQFSKRLQQEFPGKVDSTKNILMYYYDFWSKWVNLEKGPKESLEIIEKENERNFNRILLDKLSEKYNDVGIDINLSTEEVLKLLKGTSVEEDYLNKLLKDIYERL